MNFAPVFTSWRDTSIHHSRRERRLPHNRWPGIGSPIINWSIDKSGRPVNRPEQPSSLPPSSIQSTRHPTKLQVRPIYLFSLLFDASSWWILPFSFKANPSSVITTTVDEATGEEHKRMINKGRWKGYGPASIGFTDPSVSTPFTSHTPRWIIHVELAPYETASQRRESKTTSGRKPVGTPSNCEYLMTCLQFRIKHGLICIFYSTSKNVRCGLDRRCLTNLHHLRHETFTSIYSLLALTF